MSGRGPHVSLRPEANGKEKDGSSMDHGGSFKQYMQFKNSKLQEQFEAQQLQQPAQSELFKGVSIHVNGLTVPSHQELKQIMVCKLLTRKTSCVCAKSRVHANL